MTKRKLINYNKLIKLQKCRTKVLNLSIVIHASIRIIGG